MHFTQASTMDVFCVNTNYVEAFQSREVDYDSEATITDDEMHAVRPMKTRKRRHMSEWHYASLEQWAQVTPVGSVIKYMKDGTERYVVTKDGIISCRGRRRWDSWGRWLKDVFAERQHDRLVKGLPTVNFRGPNIKNSMFISVDGHTYKRLRVRLDHLRLCPSGLGFVQCKSEC